MLVRSSLRLRLPRWVRVCDVCRRVGGDPVPIVSGVIEVEAGSWRRVGGISWTLIGRLKSFREQECSNLVYYYVQPLKTVSSL